MKEFEPVNDDHDDEHGCDWACKGAVSKHEASKDSIQMPNAKCLPGTPYLNVFICTVAGGINTSNRTQVSSAPCSRLCHTRAIVLPGGRACFVQRQYQENNACIPCDKNCNDSGYKDLNEDKVL